MMSRCHYHCYRAKLPDNDTNMYAEDHLKSGAGAENFMQRSRGQVIYDEALNNSPNPMSYAKGTKPMMGIHQRDSRDLTSMYRVEKHLLKMDKTIPRQFTYIVEGGDVDSLRSALDFLLEGQDKHIISHIKNLPPVVEQQHRNTLTVEEEAELQVLDNDLKVLIKYGKLEIPKVAGLGVKLVTKGFREVNNISELYITRFQRVIVITLDANGKPLKDEVVSLLSERLNGYALTSCEAALLAPRLLDLGLRIKLHDVTSLPHVPFGYVPIGERLKTAIRQDTRGQLKDLNSMCYSVGHVGLTADGRVHTPTLDSQEEMQLVYQALLYFILHIDAVTCKDVIITTLEPGQAGPLAPIGAELSERLQTISNFARCETLLRLPMHDSGNVEFSSIENHEFRGRDQSGNLIKVPTLKIRCRSLKTMPQRSHRQLIRLDVCWTADERTHASHYSTLIARVLRTDGQYVWLWFPKTRANYNNTKEHLIPMNLKEDGDKIDIYKISTDGPEDPVEDLAVRYGNMMRLTRARINERLVDANGLLGLAFPSLITNKEASLEIRQLCRSRTKVFKVSHLPRGDITINDSQREFITDALTRATSDDTLPNMQRDSFRILIGPPGTGKTSTIAKMIKTLAPALEMASDSSYETLFKLEDDMLAKEKAEPEEKAAAAIRRGFEKQYGHLKDCKEAVYVITQSNFSLFKVHLALKDLEVDHTLIRGQIFGSFHDKLYAGVEEAMDGSDYSIERSLADPMEPMPLVILSTVSMFLTLFDELFGARIPSMVIIEEASTVSAHLLVSILNRAKGIVRVILAGDPLQNEPYLADHEPRMRSALEVVANEIDSHTLTTCYRLNPAFVSLLREVAYPALVSPPGATGEKKLSKCAFFYDAIKDRFGAGYDDTGASVRSEETVLASDLFVSLRQKDKCVTVICMYEAGRREIAKELNARKVTYDLAKITTVDAFQGNEDETVILVIGRRNKPGFTSKKSRQIVAITRQTAALHVVTCKQFIESALKGTPLGVLAEKATWLDLDCKRLKTESSSDSERSETPQTHYPVASSDAADVGADSIVSILREKKIGPDAMIRTLKAAVAELEKELGEPDASPHPK